MAKSILRCQMTRDVIDVRVRLDDQEVDVSTRLLFLCLSPLTTFFKLSCMFLTTVPVELFLMTNLRQLDMSKNELCELPSEIGDLARLERLNVCGRTLSLLVH
jgi:Leucine-rich repeat (LRR) protein